MFDVDELQEQNKPTLEEIKKIVDNKRLKGSKARTSSKTYTKEDRIKNLELAREKKRNTEIKPIPATEPNQDLIKSKKISEEKLVENLNTSTPIINNTFNNDLFNEIKELILNQNQILSNLNVKPARKIKNTKKQVERKTLDLTITDNEIKTIIDNKINKNSNKKEQIVDEKLQAFLDAFKR